jgi:GNAT superfamily N-acetyltransferase
MNIRFATTEDAEVIVSFINELAVYEKLSHESVVTPEQICQTLFGERKYAECLIAEISGKPAGFALFFHNYSTFLGKPGLYLEDLFVKPEFRQQGVGKSLLRRLAQIAAERNCGRFEWSVLDWNQPAIDFYENLGAKPMSEWTIFRMTEETLRNFAKG